MTSSFPSLHPKVTFWKGSNIQGLHLQPVRSTECSSKGWTTKTKPIQVTRVNFQIIRVAYSSGSLGPNFSYRCKFHTRSRSLQADLDNQQDRASSAKFCNAESASATRKRELLIIASVAIITTVMAILPNSAITVVRISVYHQPQVWWPLLKSEPYFLNCPCFLLAGGYTTELNFKFQVVLY